MTIAPLILASVQLLLRVGTALLFLVAATAKLRRHAVWLQSLAAYRLLPEALLLPAAIAIPAAEVIVAAGLIGGIGLAAAVALGAALLMLFAGAAAINLLRGRTTIDCGCDPGRPARPIGWGLVARNAALAVSLPLALLPAPPVPAGIVAITAIAGIVTILLVRTLSYLQSLAPPGNAAIPGAH